MMRFFDGYKVLGVEFVHKDGEKDRYLEVLFLQDEFPKNDRNDWVDAYDVDDVDDVEEAAKFWIGEHVDEEGMSVVFTWQDPPHAKGIKVYEMALRLCEGGYTPEDEDRLREQFDWMTDAGFESLYGEVCRLSELIGDAEMVSEILPPYMEEYEMCAES